MKQTQWEIIKPARSGSCPNDNWVNMHRQNLQLREERGKKGQQHPLPLLLINAAALNEGRVIVIMNR